MCCELMESSVVDLEHLPEYRWERNTVQAMHMIGLVNNGQYARLTRLHPRLVRAAQERGDDYLRLTLELHSGIPAWWCRDLPEQARARLDVIWADILDQRVSVFHYAHVQSSALIDLYCGDYQRGHDALYRHYKRLVGAGILRVAALRAPVLTLLAKLALVAAAASPNTDRRARARLLRTATRHIAQLRRVPVATTAARTHHLEACLALLRGSRDRAERLYRSAIRDQDRSGLRGVAQATRYRLGQLIGGDEGRTLCDRALAWFEEQSVQSPESFMAILCPPVS